MLDLNEATEKVKKIFPDGKIVDSVSYKNLFIFQVYRNKPLEEVMDPFYSVNKDTGELRDFSIINDSTPELVALFKKKLIPKKDIIR